MAEAGSSIFKKLAAMSSQKDRDRAVLQYVRSGNVPSWTWNWRPVRVSAIIDDKPYTLEYLVMPDYLALGTDDDYFWVPLLPHTVQAIADMRGAVMITPRMVEEIFANSSGRLTPQAVSPNTASVTDWAKHSIQVQQQMKTLGIPPYAFLDGHKKTIVVGPKLDGSHVAIFGWHDESGKLSKKPNAPIQGYNPTSHDSGYTDYSHGTRLAKANGYLNGTEVSLREIATDPKLHVLLSSQGPLDLHFPNTGSFAQASMTNESSDAISAAAKLASDAASAFDKGDDVTAAQMTLVALGYDLGKTGPNKDGVDGSAGPKFRTALAKFQAKEGLVPPSVPGVLDESTKKALRVRAEEIRKQKAVATAKKVGIVGAIVAAIAGTVTWVRRKKVA